MNKIHNINSKLFLILLFIIIIFSGCQTKQIDSNLKIKNNETVDTSTQKNLEEKIQKNNTLTNKDNLNKEILNNNNKSEIILNTTDINTNSSIIDNNNLSNIENISVINNNLIIKKDDIEEDEYIDDLGQYNRAKNVEELKELKAYAPYFYDCKKSCDFLEGGNICYNFCPEDNEFADCYEKCSDEYFYKICDFACPEDSTFFTCYNKCSGDEIDISCDSKCD